MDMVIKYCNYVLVSGYIPILFGRTRGTEDVDVSGEQYGIKI